MEVVSILSATPLSGKAKWLVTGVAGFIGSNLLESLLRSQQKVVGLDNFATGSKQNLEDVRRTLGEKLWKNFEFIEGDICSMQDCARACIGVDYVLHQAALGSVPRSIKHPEATNEANVTGFLNMLIATRDAGVKRFVYASSSAVYGDSPALPKVEDVTGFPLSPYAASKATNELYAGVFYNVYKTPVIGLRYFNVFGKRQDPNGPYAAVIPRWIEEVLQGRESTINGDGETSRDFCFVENVVQANLLAATCGDGKALGQVFNIAYGGRTTLNELYSEIQSISSKLCPSVQQQKPLYGEFRSGDVRHSHADISKAKSLLAYAPTYSLRAGLQEVIPWYFSSLNAKR